MYGGNANVATRHTILGQCDQARLYAEREIELYPANPWSYYNISVCTAQEGDQAASFAAYREAVERGVEDTYHWWFDLEGSAAERGLALELSGIDLYGQKSIVHYTVTNSASVGVWLTEVEVEWPGGRETSHTNLEDLELAAGAVGWTTDWADTAISPGDWLRVTARCQLHTSGDNWVELIVETTVPELE